MNYNLNPSFSSLTIDIAPSYRLAVLLIVIGLSACFCLHFMPVQLWMRVLLGLFVVALTSHAVLLHALLILPRSITQLHFHVKGPQHQAQWEIKQYNGEQLTVNFDDSTFVAAYGTVLNVHADSQTTIKTILLLPSRVETQAFRRLRVLLRWMHRMEVALT